MPKIWRSFTTFFLALLFVFFTAIPVHAAGEVLGIHILNPDEIGMADELVSIPGKDEYWSYVTIPFTLKDVDELDRWQHFFNEAEKKKIIPVVRLVTTFENNAWIVPNRKQLTDQISALNKLDWPIRQRYLIIFNEVNHAPEWGGRINPAEYAETLVFAGNWAHAENKDFVVMPAAMDLAAPNGGSTMEAFTYLSAMYDTNPEVFEVIDIWNSHSYPNPGFSSSPERTAKNSLRGFQHELSFLKEKTDKDFKVMITETGWVANGTTTPWLESYYRYALEHIWSQPEVIGVTPFVLRGDPGPFAGFAFLDRNNNPTIQYLAFKKALNDFNQVGQ